MDMLWTPLKIPLYVTGWWVGECMHVSWQRAITAIKLMEKVQLLWKIEAKHFLSRQEKGNWKS